MTQNPSMPLRLASYNIRKAVGLDWVRDPERILNVIREVDADIIAIQEIDKRFGKREGTLPSIDLLEQYGYHIARSNLRPHSQGWHGNAILYRTGIELIDCSEIILPTLEPRGAVTARLRRQCGRSIRMIATHLSLAGFMRNRQVLELLRYAGQFADEDPIVIAGDFNEWRANGKAVRNLTTGFRVVTPGPSFHSSRPYLPLDRFVVSKDISVLSEGVHNSDLARRASDHLPIFITIATTQYEMASFAGSEMAGQP